MEFLLYPIVFYALLIALKYIITFQQLLGIKIGFPRYQVAAKDRVPAYLRELFEAAIEQLKPFEFRPISYLEIEPVFKLGYPQVWEILLYNKTLRTYAKVGIRRPVEPVSLFDIELLTVLPDQTLLYTMNGKADSVLGELPGVVLQDPYCASFEEQLRVHQSKLEQLSSSSDLRALLPQEFAKSLEDLGQRYLTQQIDRKQIRKSSYPAEFRLNWRFILQFLPHLSRHQKKYTKLLRQLQSQAKSKPSLQMEIPIELEVEGFHRTEQLQKGASQGRNTKLGILLGSFVLFLVAYAQVFPVQQLAIFVVALTLHEGGHLFAMKRFGYQDTSIFFIPFLGALATARKTDATLAQKFWVSLAGPLPGLILGIAAIFAAQSGSYPNWVSDAGWIFITLNLFNLLPVYPLDGGQIADLLVFSRSPYLGVVFKGIGVILLLLLGLGKPMLLMFALLIGLTIPFSFRSDRMTAKVGKELSNLPTQDTDTVLFFIFQKIRQMGYGKLPTAQRHVLAKTLIDRQREAQTKWTTRLFLAVLYLFSLVGGATGALFAAVPEVQTVLPYLLNNSKKAEEFRAVQQKQIEQATQTLKTDSNNLKAYQKRAEAYLMLGDRQSALSDYNQLVRLNPQNTDFLIARAGVQAGNRSYQAAIQDYDRVLQLKPERIDIYSLRAGLYTQLKEYQAALKDYNKVIQLNNNQAYNYFERGDIRLRLKDYKGAIADADEAIRRLADFAEAYELRSQARQKLGDQKGAIADQRKADALYQAEDSP